MRSIFALAFGLIAAPAMAQDNRVMTDQVTNRVIARSGGNISEIVQGGGSGNMATNDQSGFGNRASIRQDGMGNTASVVQSGSDNSADSTQTGNNLGLTITQSGAAGDIRIQQTSPGPGGATIFRSGPGSVTVR